MMSVMGCYANYSSHGLSMLEPCRTMSQLAPQSLVMPNGMQEPGFQQYWANEYPACPPIGFLLREKYKDRWFRIHSLPGSKRYPENDDEMREVLHRHNAILDALLPPGSDFALLTTGYSDEPTPVLPLLLQNDSTLSGSSSFAFSVRSDMGCPHWHFFVNTFIWQRGCLDMVFAQVATDTVALEATDGRSAVSSFKST